MELPVPGPCVRQGRDAAAAVAHRGRIGIERLSDPPRPRPREQHLHREDEVLARAQSLVVV